MAISEPNDTYRLDRIRATPYPNRLLELSITMPETQARIVALVVRNSLGWYGGQSGTRKASAYFTFKQLRECVGRRSQLAILEALHALVKLGVLEVLTPEGVAISVSSLRYYHMALRLRIARRYVEEPAYSPGDNSGEKARRS